MNRTTHFSSFSIVFTSRHQRGNMRTKGAVKRLVRSVPTPHLPQEIIAKIISICGVTSVLALVCKEWAATVILERAVALREGLEEAEEHVQDLCDHVNSMASTYHGFCDAFEIDMANDIFSVSDFIQETITLYSEPLDVFGTHCDVPLIVYRCVDDEWTTFEFALDARTNSVDPLSLEAFEEDEETEPPPVEGDSVIVVPKHGHFESLAEKIDNLEAMASKFAARVTSSSLR